MLAAVLATGCLIPPPLEKEGSDGGPNHAPQIRLDITQPAPGPLTRAQTAVGATKKVAITFSVGVFDPDPQTLHLNIFIDGVKEFYAKPIRSEQAAPTSTGLRAFIIDLEGPCDEVVNYETGPHILEFYISDTGFNSEGDQRAPKSGGQAVSIPWLLSCIFPPGSVDGGV